MKPGDLIRVSLNAPRAVHISGSYETHGKVGMIVVLSSLVNDHRIWDVMIDGEIFPIRERHLELINEVG
jgi:hypothetical protein